jgi:tRNA threonylcarbamoyladenosine biosynthesis protein TsaE
MNREQLSLYRSDSEIQTNKFAMNAVTYFNEGDTILLYGNLGSGKTYLVKQFVNALGVNEEVTSPTFSIINQYSGAHLINHIDLYRIPNKRELINLGLEDIWEMNSINFVEWPHLIEGQLNEKHYRIYISVEQNHLLYRNFSLYRYHFK